MLFLSFFGLFVFECFTVLRSLSLGKEMTNVNEAAAIKMKQKKYKLVWAA